MNRLNFTQMVNKTLLDQQDNKFFNVTQIHPDAYFESETRGAKIKQAKERLNLDNKIKNVVLSVHKQLRERQVSTSPLKVKSKSTKEKLKTKRQPLTKQDETGQKRTSVEIATCENISLPRMKVLCSDIHKVLSHKSTETTSNYLSFENHKRMLMAQQRKNDLENMIKEHKLLIEDRRSLEQDILVMRHSLDDLQHRVSKSLQELKNKKTFCECHGLSNKNCKDIS